MSSIEYFPEPDVLAEATLPDGRRVQITPLTYGRARINVVNPIVPLTYDPAY